MKLTATKKQVFFEKRKHSYFKHLLSFITIDLFYKFICWYFHWICNQITLSIQDQVPQSIIYLITHVMMKMICFCKMVDQRKVFSLISSQDYCQRSSESRITNTLWAGFKPVHNQSSGLVEWSYVVVLTTTLQHQKTLIKTCFDLHDKTHWLVSA